MSFGSKGFQIGETILSGSSPASLLISPLQHRLSSNDSFCFRPHVTASMHPPFAAALYRHAFAQTTRSGKLQRYRELITRSRDSCSYCYQSCPCIQDLRILLSMSNVVFDVSHLMSITSPRSPSCHAIGRWHQPNVLPSLVSALSL